MTGKFDDRTSAPVFCVLHNNMYLFGYICDFASLAKQNISYYFCTHCFRRVETFFFVEGCTLARASSRGGFLIGYYTLPLKLNMILAKNKGYCIKGNFWFISL